MDVRGGGAGEFTAIAAPGAREPALLRACSAASQTRGRGCWRTHRQASPPSRDLGSHSATQHFKSLASSAKPFELASGLINVAVPDVANATGVRWLNPAGCRCQLR